MKNCNNWTNIDKGASVLTGTKWPAFCNPPSFLLHIGLCQYDLISQWKGRNSVSDRLTSSLFEGVGGSTKGGAVGEGPRSMTVLDTLIDPVEKGAITAN